MIYYNSIWPYYETFLLVQAHFWNLKVTCFEIFLKKFTFTFFFKLLLNSPFLFSSQNRWLRWKLLIVLVRHDHVRRSLSEHGIWDLGGLHISLWILFLLTLWQIYISIISCISTTNACSCATLILVCSLGLFRWIDFWNLQPLLFVIAFTVILHLIMVGLSTFGNYQIAGGFLSFL